MKINTPIEKQKLRAYLPHSGDMCLLDSVEAWDDFTLLCFATSHCDKDNPLRHNDQLPICAGIEYAAQAMAIHGTLRANPTGLGAWSPPQMGCLATLTQVHWEVQRLDIYEGHLSVRVERLLAVDGGFSYQFQIDCGQDRLMDGRALIALQVV